MPLGVLRINVQKFNNFSVLAFIWLSNRHFGIVWYNFNENGPASNSIIWTSDGSLLQVVDFALTKCTNGFELNDWVLNRRYFLSDRGWRRLWWDWLLAYLADPFNHCSDHSNIFLDSLLSFAAHLSGFPRSFSVHNNYRFFERSSFSWVNDFWWTCATKWCSKHSKLMSPSSTILKPLLGNLLCRELSRGLQYD